MPKRSMTEEDRDIIRRFASGDQSARAGAEAVFRDCYSTQPKETEMRFMSEALNPVPDLLLRSRYRQELKRADS
jgi:hypothetical protein